MREVKVALSTGDNGITAGSVVDCGCTQISLCGDGAVHDAGSGNMTSLIL